MAYEYITDNNLYQRQTYMYSKYKGILFFKEYLETRQYYLDSQKSPQSPRKEEAVYSDIRDNIIKNDLEKIYRKLKNGICDRKILETVNNYVKSFEVRKRIYTGYDRYWKPLPNAGFEDFAEYLLFAECLVLTYDYTKCLKYFSCLLKIDDTMLSVRNKLDYKQKAWLYEIIRSELSVFYRLADEMGINMEAVQ